MQINVIKQYMECSPMVDLQDRTQHGRIGKLPPVAVYEVLYLKNLSLIHLALIHLTNIY